MTFLNEVELIFKLYKNNLAGGRKDCSPKKDPGTENIFEGSGNAKEAILTFSKLMDSMKVFCKSQLFNALKNGLMSDIDV